MQTSRDNITLAGTQVPLLRAEQLQPGVLVTGVAMSHVWEVLTVARNNVLIRKLPATTVPCGEDAHAMEIYGRGYVCSRCQTRKQPVADFLPKREDKARAHIITPSSAMLAPQPYTLYAYLLPNGTAQTVYLETSNWNQALPIIPKLAIVWTIPEALRVLAKGTPVNNDYEIQF